MLKKRNRNPRIGSAQCVVPLRSLFIVSVMVRGLQHVCSSGGPRNRCAAGTRDCLVCDYFSASGWTCAACQFLYGFHFLFFNILFSSPFPFSSAFCSSSLFLASGSQNHIRNIMRQSKGWKCQKQKDVFSIPRRCLTILSSLEPHDDSITDSQAMRMENKR